MANFTLNPLGRALCYTIRNLWVLRLLRFKHDIVVGVVNEDAPEETERQ
jgi:hypothetical protein